MAISVTRLIPSRSALTSRSYRPSPAERWRRRAPLALAGN